MIVLCYYHLMSLYTQSGDKIDILIPLLWLAPPSYKLNELEIHIMATTTSFKLTSVCILKTGNNITLFMKLIKILIT